MHELPRRLNYAWPYTLYFFPNYQLGGSEKLAALLEAKKSAISQVEEAYP